MTETQESLYPIIQDINYRAPEGCCLFYIAGPEAANFAPQPWKNGVWQICHDMNLRDILLNSPTKPLGSFSAVFRDPQNNNQYDLAANVSMIRCHPNTIATAYLQDNYQGNGVDVSGAKGLIALYQMTPDLNDKIRSVKFKLIVPKPLPPLPPAPAPVVAPSQDALYPIITDINYRAPEGCCLFLIAGPEAANYAPGQWKNGVWQICHDMNLKDILLNSVTHPLGSFSSVFRDPQNNNVYDLASNVSMIRCNANTIATAYLQDNFQGAGVDVSGAKGLIALYQMTPDLNDKIRSVKFTLINKEPKEEVPPCACTE